ncbi:MAG TPA: hypothetical protein VL359_01630, partial [bacterium]|nr:hypothetical protein [bacterium]
LRALRSRGRGRAPQLILLDEGLPRQTVVTAVKHGIAARLALPAKLSTLREAMVQAELGVDAAAPPAASSALGFRLPAAAHRAPATD